MQKGLIRKGLVLSVIVLFIGVGIQPVFAGESITTTLDKDEDCIECQESDGISLLRAKILLFRVKVVTNIILSSKLGEIPEVKEDCQEILDAIKSYKPLDTPFICDVLLNPIIKLGLKIIEYIFSEEATLMGFMISFMILSSLEVIFITISNAFNCEGWEPSEVMISSLQRLRI